MKRNYSKANPIPPHKLKALEKRHRENMRRAFADDPNSIPDELKNIKRVKR